MAITKQKKQEIVTKLSDICKTAKTVVFVSFTKLGANEANELRAKCADESVGYCVAKKTLIKKVFGDASFEGDIPVLEGEIAIAYSEDQIAPARVITQINKDIEGEATIIGGIFENKYITKEQMQEIGSIPPIPVLYAQFMTVIRSPIQGFASVINQIADKKA